MTREELVKAAWEEQHRQHSLSRRSHPGGAHKGRPGHRPPARQEHLLHVLKEHPDVNQKDFAELLHVRPQSLREMLVKLEESGLVTRTKDPSDGRVTLVKLTAAGEAAEQEHHEKVVKEITARYSALTDDELVEYLRLIRKMNDAMETEKEL